MKYLLIIYVVLELTVLSWLLPQHSQPQVWCLGWEGSLEKEMVTHSRILAWRIPWTEVSELQVHGAEKTWSWLSDLTHTLTSFENSNPYHILKYSPFWCWREFNKWTWMEGGKVQPIWLYHKIILIVTIINQNKMSIHFVKEVS